MKLFCGALKSDLSRTFTSFGFWTVVILIPIASFIFCFSSTYTTDFWYSLSLTYSDFMLRIVFFPITALAGATSFCVDLNHRFYRSLIQRTGRRIYLATRVVTVFISTFLAVFLGKLFYFLILSLICCFQPGAFNASSLLSDFRAFGSLVQEENMILLFFCLTLLVAAYYACYSLVALLISVWFQNVFVVLSTSLVVSYVYANVQEGLQSYVPNMFDIDVILDGGVAMGNWWQSLLYGLSIIVFIGIVIGMIFFFSAGRRLKNA